MGTSLSGLTPATTFDGLLKTSDNEPLDGTLKAISTGDGTDTILSLSDSALQVNGPATIVSDNIGNDILFQINTSSGGLLNISNLNSAATPVLGISHGSQDTRLSMYSTMGFRVQGVGIADMTSSEVRVGGGSGARLAVKGSGATSATTSLLVQNSAGTDMLKVADDGAITAGSTFYTSGFGLHMYSNKYLRSNNNLLYLADSNGNIRMKSTGDYEFTDGTITTLKLTNAGDVGIGETTPTARLHVKGSGNDNTTISLLVQEGNGVQLIRARDDGQIQLGKSSNFTVDGTTTYNRYGLVVGSTSAAASTRAYIKGSGATSATTALLVQNSAGTELMSVDDDGAVRANSIKGINYQNNHLSLGANAEFINFLSITAPKIGVNAVVPTGTQAIIKGSGNDATTTALLVQNSDGDELMKVLDEGDINMLPDTKTLTLGSRISITPNNQSSIQWQGSNGSMIISGRGKGIFLGDVAATPTARLQVKGSGATSATTALLVQNSAGTELLKVNDAGLTNVDSLSVFDYVLLGQMVLRNDTIYRGNNASGVLQIQNDSLSFSSTSGVTNDASAMFQLESTTKGFLPPRMTTTERDAISSPASGLMVYNTTTNKAQCYNGTAWQDLF